MASQSKKNARKAGLSEKQKKVIFISTGSVILIAASYWAYMTFTTVPPPSLEKASPQEVVEFFGNDRGYGRMSIDQRGQYVAQAYQKFADGPNREMLAKAFSEMSSSEKQVFVDRSFDAFKKTFLENAAEYNRLPKNKRDQFVDKMIGTFEGQRQSLAGGGGNDNLGEAFKGFVPNTTDGMTKALVSRTNSRQRAKAQPLFDHVATRYKELKDSGKMP